MMEPRDFVSMIVGAVVAALGAIPFLEKAGTFNLGLSDLLSKVLAANIAIYLVAGFGLYLAINSIIEITNSNAFGGFSLLVAALFTILGLIFIIPTFSGLASKIPVISQTIFQIIFIVEGVFLMIAGFMMEM